MGVQRRLALEKCRSIHQGEAGFRRVRTLVAALDAGARPGLLATVASKNAVADGDGMLDSELV